jgi:hypothetical protein
MVLQHRGECRQWEHDGRRTMEDMERQII